MLQHDLLLRLVLVTAREGRDPVQDLGAQLLLGLVEKHRQGRGLHTLPNWLQGFKVVLLKSKPNVLQMCSP